MPTPGSAWALEVDTSLASRGVTRMLDAIVAERGQPLAIRSTHHARKCRVVAGIGMTPAIELFQGSGFDIENGIVVNEFLETNHKQVYAAGDVANYPDVIFEKRRRVEHWDNAVSQAQHWARTVTGDRQPF